jgi:cytoskeletal protein CcmA (bactofilin family)
MFSTKSKSDCPATTSIIGNGVTVTGDINSTADIRIDGNLFGNVKSSARVFIGADAVVEGNIEGNNADILGQVKGIVKVKELLNIHGKALITGDIYTNKLQVEPSASFNGHCYMTGNVIVEMKAENNERAKVAAK